MDFEGHSIPCGRLHVQKQAGHCLLMFHLQLPIVEDIALLSRLQILPIGASKNMTLRRSEDLALDSVHRELTTSW